MYILSASQHARVLQSILRLILRSTVQQFFLKLKMGHKPEMFVVLWKLLTPLFDISLQNTTFLAIEVQVSRIPDSSSVKHSFSDYKLRTVTGRSVRGARRLRVYQFSLSNILNACTFTAQLFANPHTGSSAKQSLGMYQNFKHEKMARKLLQATFCSVKYYLSSSSSSGSRSSSFLGLINTS